MIKRLITIILFFSTLTLAAQDVANDKSLVPTNAIKFSPLHLLNFYPTIELSYERKIWRDFTFQVEAGYVLNNPNQHTDYENMRGIKWKVEPRYYFHQANKRVIFYGALEFYKNIINFDRETHVVECFDTFCTSQFDRKYNYVVKYREHGASVKGGIGIHFNKIFMDFNAGITIRSIDYDDPIEGGTNLNDVVFFYFGPNEEDRVTFSPVVGIRLGYRFN